MARSPSLRFALAVALLGAGGCSIELEHGLDERQANEVVAALEGSGIVAEKSADDAPAMFKVLVGRGEAAQAFLVLESRALPRRAGKGTSEAFGDKGILPSPTAERARLAASLATDLERTIEALPGVTTARVHLALPERDALQAPVDHQRPTASVVLRAKRGAAITEGEVKRIVAGAVEGLQSADVTVVLAASDDAPAPPELVQVGPLRVARGSRGLALGLLAGALLLIALLAAALAWSGLRLVALRGQLRK